MLTPEHIQAARNIVKEADRAFDAGDVRLGSQKLWDAAASLVAIVAKQRGWPHETPSDLGDAAEYLGKERGYDPDLGGEFGAAEYLLDNARHNFMRPYELDDCRDAVQSFIENMQALTR